MLLFSFKISSINIISNISVTAKFDLFIYLNSNGIEIGKIILEKIMNLNLCFIIHTLKYNVEQWVIILFMIKKNIFQSGYLENNYH